LVTIFSKFFWLLISFEWLFGSGGNSVFRPFSAGFSPFETSQCGYCLNIGNIFSRIWKNFCLAPSCLAINFKVKIVFIVKTC